MPSAVQLALDLPAMARLDLTDDERDELARALREMIDGDRFPLSARVRRLKTILDKLDPLKAPAASPSPFPPPRLLPSPATRSAGGGARDRFRGRAARSRPGCGSRLRRGTVSIVERDAKARDGDYGHPHAQEEPKVEPIHPAASVINCRHQLLVLIVLIVLMSKNAVPRGHELAPRGSVCPGSVSDYRPNPA